MLTRSGLTYPEVSLKVYHESFWQLGSSISLPWVIYFEAFYLHVVSSLSCIPVICPKLVLFTAFIKSEFKERGSCAVTAMFVYVMPQRIRAVLCMGAVRAWRCIVYRVPKNGKISVIKTLELWVRNFRIGIKDNKYFTTAPQVTFYTHTHKHTHKHTQ